MVVWILQGQFDVVENLTNNTTYHFRVTKNTVTRVLTLHDAQRASSSSDERAERVRSEMLQPGPELTVA